MHHGVEITDSGDRGRGRRLSDRYISDRFLPDKAIDLIDEAAARIKHGDRLSKPEVIDELDRRVIQLEIEQRGAEEGEGRRLAEASWR